MLLLGENSFFIIEALCFKYVTVSITNTTFKECSTEFSVLYTKSLFCPLYN